VGTRDPTKDSASTEWHHFSIYPRITIPGTTSAPDRTVYIEGDPNIHFAVVAIAIDAAKSSYASRVVLVTPNCGTAPRAKP
jgi:hypothetical protein